ncbi:hypothetical protein SPFL3102_00659 [Sporomusaceae bacterium FL31]|nr:hypothetical protein SPFL3101_00501 [Sporomusaceae bacterium FL31]GCE32858.1 hypothetical protein SPFL3102_00659 [Sporomusaceae bacterium]
MLKKILIMLLVTQFAVLSAGCSKSGPSPSGEVTPNQISPIVSEEQQKQIMNDYQQLIEKPSVQPSEVRAYIDKNIAQVTSQNAVVMVNALEQVQRKHLTKLEGEFFNDHAVQEQLQKNFAPGSDLTNLTVVKDQTLKNLLQEIKENGYKIEIAEGMYYPIIDYSIYQKYDSMLPGDIAAYHNLMAAESNKAAAKDAALVIGWNEVIQRALAQEKFLSQYGNSPKAAEVKELYKRYVFFSFYGANNTPLFDYETKTFNSEAKSAYEQVVGLDTSSNLLTQLKSYLAVLANNHYKLTDEVNQFRKAATDHLTK